jgi:acyl-CoA synthetase (AMP-forming)/AMP-acid ligase II
VRITHANVVANAEAMFVGAHFDMDTDVIVSWLPCFHDMGMTGFLAVPMYFGAELVKVTPLDFLRDALLWVELIDEYQGTMTAALTSPTTCWPGDCDRPSRANSTRPRCDGRCRAPSRWIPLMSKSCAPLVRASA